MPRGVPCRRETPEINFFLGRCVRKPGWISPCYAIQPLGGDHRERLRERLLFLLADRGRRRPRNVARLLSENRPLGSLTRSRRSGLKKRSIFQFGQPHISAVRQRDRQIYMRSLRHGGGSRASPFAAAFWKPKIPDTLWREGREGEGLRH